MHGPRGAGALLEHTHVARADVERVAAVDGDGGAACDHDEHLVRLRVHHDPRRDLPDAADDAAVLALPDHTVPGLGRSLDDAGRIERVRIEVEVSDVNGEAARA